MKKKFIIRLFAGIAVFIILVKVLTTFVVEPWIGNKIQDSVAKINNAYSLHIDKVQLRWFSQSLQLDGISLISNPEQMDKTEVKASISSVNIGGIRIFQWLFHHQIVIRELLVSGSDIQSKIPFSNKNAKAILAPRNIRIGEILLDTMQLEFRNTLNDKAYFVEKGIVKIFDFEWNKLDILSAKSLHRFDFEATAFRLVSADSMYAYDVHDIIYSGTSETLVADSFNIQPAFPNEEFAAMHEFQTDRIEARFKNIFVYRFSVAEFIQSGSLKSSFAEIGNMDMKVFRDKRMNFRHNNKPVFQEMIRDYPGHLSIDTLSLLNGNIQYAVREPKANEAGSINFNQVKAKIYKISNDSIYNTKKAYLELQAEGLLMGKGKIIMKLKSEINQASNVFSLQGSLSEMESSALNPILEKSAFLKVKSGEIESMNFEFVADNMRSTGSMLLLYHGLELAVLNKQTEKTTALKEEIVAAFINMKILDSNPLNGENIRKGTISSERDPERFLFNYCFRSILSGMKTSITKAEKNK
jgi:hypothetical protein